MDPHLMPTVWQLQEQQSKYLETPLPHFQNPSLSLGRQPNPWSFRGPGFSRAVLCGCPYGSTLLSLGVFVQIRT